MLVVTTQEIIGSALLPSSHKDGVIAYYLEDSFSLPENEQEKELIEKEPSIGSLLLGHYYPVVECNRTVQKFKPFASIPVYNKEQALSFWNGKTRSSRENN